MSVLVGQEPVIVGSGGPLEFGELSTASSTADASSYSFTSFGFGDAAASRLIIIAVHWGSSANNVTVSGATIGGISASVINASSSRRGAALIWAVVPTGTSGTVAITFSTTVLRCAIYGYRAANVTAAAHDQQSVNSLSSSAYTVALNVPAGGFVVAASTVIDASGGTWAGATERYDTTLEVSSNRQSGGSESGLSQQTGRTVSVTWSGAGNEGGLVAASWGR